MNVAASFTPLASDSATRVIKLAIMAVGGQGGGVLTGWIEALARAQGYACQATSVAGVSQRTGATIYYLEMCPASNAAPVFSLAPSAGDVDILIAAEMMEAGRAIMRGFVTPDRTTLIASTHRALAVSEKSAPGDGAASSEEVRAAAELAARRLVLGDWNAIAAREGSVISAALFGALAGAGVLPFERGAFEDAIRRGGRGVETSLRAFDAGFRGVEAGEEATPMLTTTNSAPAGPDHLLTEWRRLAERVAALPTPVAEMAKHGLRKVVDFQDIAYGDEYLDRLDTVLRLDAAAHDWLLSAEAAKHLCNAMTYDDVIRVADLKTRGDRHARIRREMNAGTADVMRLTEFLRPRAEEIIGMAPASLGARLAASEKWRGRIERWFCKGRRVRSSGGVGYLALHLIGGLRWWRRRTYRHRIERAHLDDWLALAIRHVARDYRLGVEIIRCRRLIKGYSDTHARGLSKFDRVVRAVDLVAGRDDAADWIARLREAALKDEKGDALDGALKTVRSFLG